MQYITAISILYIKYVINKTNTYHKIDVQLPNNKTSVEIRP